MDHSYWQERWDTQDIRFHRSEANAFLVKLAERLKPYRRIYVPLCGKSLDLVQLAQQGHTVFGTELAQTALQQFFAERGLTANLSTQGPFTQHSGPERAFTLLQGDAFALAPEHLGGQVDAIYDRASLVALDPKTRQTFVESLDRVLRPGGVIFLVTFDYDQAKADGPPWAVSASHVEDLFASFGSISELESRSDAVSPSMAQKGVSTVYERAYWITKKALA
jgi:thiopurine S-methyltransferase